MSPAVGLTGKAPISQDQCLILSHIYYRKFTQQDVVIINVVTNYITN